MASGFLGLQNPFNRSPMESLTAIAGDGAGQGSPSPPPAPAVAPAPAPAAVADPATTGAIGAGGGGLGGVLGRLFSGQGVMGPQPGDDKVDPNTGATAGQMRQVSMQSMMGMGLTLLAAGMRQTDDQRAAIMARLPAFANNSDQINAFAKTRLELANARLAERKAANDEQRSSMWRDAMFGGSGAAQGVPGSVGAAGAPAALPGTVGTTGTITDPAAGAAAVAGAPAPTRGPAPVQMAGGAPAPAAAPRGGLLDGISPGVRTMLGVLGPDKGAEKLLDIRRGLDEQETMGEPYQDPNTGKWIADKVKNGRRTGIVDLGLGRETAGPATVDPDTGRKTQQFQRDGIPTRTENLGDVPRPIETVTEEGRRFNVRRNAAGAVIEKTLIPEGSQDQIEVERGKQYVKMEGDIRDGRKSGARMLGMLNDFQKVIDNEAVYFGPGADKVAAGKRLLSVFGGSTEGVADASLATKIQNQLALMVRAPGGEFGGLPGSATDRDLTFLLDSVPNLMATREGAQLVKDSFAKAAERNIEIDKMRREYLKTNKSLDVGFEDRVAEKFDSPLLEESQRKTIERLTRGPAAADPAPAGQTTTPTRDYTAEQRAAAAAELARRRAAAGR